MDRRIVQVFYGPGKGKTSAAVGQCIRAASLGQSVIIIQFLKGNDAEEFNFLEKLEPDIKLFRFEKEKESFSELLASQKKEETQNILNGVNFARKVIDTGGCDVLVLAGKGHEDYQVLPNNVHIHMDEREIVADCLTKL